LNQQEAWSSNSADRLAVLNEVYATGCELDSDNSGLTDQIAAHVRAKPARQFLNPYSFTAAGEFSHSSEQQLLDRAPSTGMAWICSGLSVNLRQQAFPKVGKVSVRMSGGGDPLVHLHQMHLIPRDVFAGEGT
jgi:hypothetical protein